MRPLVVLATVIGINLASVSWAALPVNITFKENRTSLDGQPFLLYTLECSDGKQQAITAWKNRSLWCPSYKLVEGRCEDKQVTLAKALCQSTVLES